MLVSVIQYSVTVIHNHITACCAHSKHTATKQQTDALINLTKMTYRGILKHTYKKIKPSDAVSYRKLSTVYKLRNKRETMS